MFSLLKYITQKYLNFCYWFSLNNFLNDDKRMNSWDLITF